MASTEAGSPEQAENPFYKRPRGFMSRSLGQIPADL